MRLATPLTAAPAAHRGAPARALDGEVVEWTAMWFDAPVRAVRKRR